MGARRSRDRKGKTRGGAEGESGRRGEGRRITTEGTEFQRGKHANSRMEFG